MKDKYLNTLYLRGYSEHTLRGYKADLLDFEKFLLTLEKDTNESSNRYSLSKRETRRFLYYLDERKLSPKTIGRKLSTIRSFYTYLRKEGLIEVDYFAGLDSPKVPKRLPKIISNKVMEDIFDSFNMKDPLEFRNYIILEILYSCGFRVSELVNIKLKDINFHSSTILVHGKGSKDRIMPMHKTLRNNLKKYINTVRNTLITKNSIKPDHNYLLINYKGTKLSDRSIRTILNKIIVDVDDIYAIHPHMVRHSFATTLLESGVDLRVLQEMLGHSSLKSTQIYTHVSDSKIKADFDNKHPRTKMEDKNV